MFVGSRECCFQGGGVVLSDGYGFSGVCRETQDSCRGGERLLLQRRWQRGWRRLVMVSAAVAAAFVLEAFPSVVQRWVFFWCVVDAGYFLVGIQQRRGWWWSDEESRT